jgi:hypothetical protein
MIVHHEKGLERIRSAPGWRIRGLLPAASRSVFITSDLGLTVTGLLDLWDADVAGVMENAESKQQPHDNANHHDDVEDFFYLSVHRDVGIDQPKQHTDDDQSDGERN